MVAILAPRRHVRLDRGEGARDLLANQRNSHHAHTDDQRQHNCVLNRRRTVLTIDERLEPRYQASHFPLPTIRAKARSLRRGLTDYVSIHSTPSPGKSIYNCVFATLVIGPVRETASMVRLDPLNLGCFTPDKSQLRPILTRASVRKLPAKPLHAPPPLVIAWPIISLPYLTAPG